MSDYKYYDSTYYLKHSNINKEQREKELAQKEYTDNHIKNVQKAWGMMKESVEIMDYIKELVKTKYIPCAYIYSSGFFNMMDIQISIHDASKYGPNEWDQYRTNFYPINDKEKEDHKDDFKAAWLHHYTVNKHHWNYWYKIYKDENAMDLSSVLELCCDWIAMNFISIITAYISTHPCEHDILYYMCKLIKENEELVIPFNTFIQNITGTNLDTVIRKILNS